MKKYLFLDFDGVLNTKLHCHSLQKNNEHSTDEFGAIFDPIAIQNLKQIIEQTDAKIVISSSWKEYGRDFIHELWGKRNMPGKIYSITSSLFITNYIDHNTNESFSIPERYSKGLEINAWLNTYATNDDIYCIIDDENYFLPYQLEHLVQVDEESGLTCKHASLIIEKLNRV